MTKKKRPISVVDPNKLPVTKRRANYLAKLAGLDEKKLAGRTVKEVNELMKWRVDPSLLFFRRVCGQVVKRNPNGSFCPVPGATVHVYDTDCTFLGFFPVEPPFFWLLPVHCHREELATVTTDACGRFCVNLPFWDIDRILRLRRQWICFPDIHKLRLKDILEPLPDPPEFRIPRPIPDPVPFGHIAPETIARVRSHFGDDIADRLEVQADNLELGASVSEFANLLDIPLPTSPPPLPKTFFKKPREAFEAMAGETGLENIDLQKLDHMRFLGPFIRCKEVLVAEWATFFDIPDITFGVTQDVDGDGNEEVIYDEGFFDVRWNEDPVSNVVLEADASAICVPICGPVEEIPCENEPVISTAGYMPLEPTHHDDTTGYGKRVNRPTVTGNYPPPPATGAGAATAFSPYARTLNLHGCHRIGDASHYRLTYILNGVGGPMSFTGISWWAPRLFGPPIHISSDPDGWYPILNPVDLAHPNWLLYWNTRSFPNGTYEVRLECGIPGGGGMVVLSTSDPRTFKIDNSRPTVSYDLVRWRYAAAAGPWTDLPATCPVINRLPQAIRVQVRWSATASHLRDAMLTFSGCGAGNPFRLDPVEDYQEWYTAEFDNTVSQINEFEIPAEAAPGCYSLRIRAWSRAFNPSGFDHGPAHNWLINQWLLHATQYRSISIVNL